MNPIQEVTVLPLYGANECFLSWRFIPGFEGAKVFIYKSPSGVHGSWELVSPEIAAPTLQDGMWVDRSGLFTGGTKPETWYVISVLQDGVYHDSPPVSAFATLPKQEFITVRRMLQMEYLEMRLQSGQPVRHLVFPQNGGRAANINPITEQVDSGPCEDITADGTPYSGGYATPYPTFMKIAPGEGVTFKEQDNEQGFGVTRSSQTMAILLSWPTPSVGDLLVRVADDARWVITGPVTENSFRGIYPITYTAAIDRLPPGDPLFNIPVGSQELWQPSIKHLI